MTDEEVLLEVDKRRRVSLGDLATKQRYLAKLEPDGTIILTPAVVMPIALAQGIEQFLDDPSQGVRLSRPDRTQK